MLIYFDLDISQGYGIRKPEIRLFTSYNPVCLTRVSKKLNIEKTRDFRYRSHVKFGFVLISF